LISYASPASSSDDEVVFSRGFSDSFHDIAAAHQFFEKNMNKWFRSTSHLVQEPMHNDLLTGGAGAEVAADHELVVRSQAGELQAFDELVMRHRHRIFAMIRQMTDHEADAWDLTQDVFVKAWQALAGFESKAKFSTWLYRIAHNVVYDWNRKRKHEWAGELRDETLEQQVIDPAAIAIPQVVSSPDEQLATEELRDKIERALQKISPEHREVVILKDVQGLSYKEIASVLGCTIGTVMSRLFYARQKLQTLLKDEYEARS
jgi:RNA polymerase sigma-70 factor (ECF subfamily)